MNMSAVFPAAECGPLPVQSIPVSPAPGTSTTLMGYGESSATNALVPITNPHHQWDLGLFQLLAFALRDAWNASPGEERYGVHIKGPPGVGKTSSVLQLCAALGTPCASVEADEDLDIKELMTTVSVESGTLNKGYGALRRAMELGYPFVLNEWDNARPGQLTKIFSILDNGTYLTEEGERIVAKRGFLLVLTSNAGGDGDLTGNTSGARRQSEALKRRVKGYDLDYASMADEENYLVARLALPSKVVRPFVRVAEDTRGQYRAGINGTIGNTVPLNSAITRQQLASWLRQGRAYLEEAVQAGPLANPITPWIRALEQTYGHALLPIQRSSVNTAAETAILGIAKELYEQVKAKRLPPSAVAA